MEGLGAEGGWEERRTRKNLETEAVRRRMTMNRGVNKRRGERKGE